MIRVNFARLLIYLCFSQMIPSIGFADECSIIGIFDAKKYSSNLNQSCLEELPPSEYNQLVSIIAESSVDNHILQGNNNKNHDQLILITIELFKKTGNKEYSNSLLKLLEAQKLTTLQDYFDDDCTPLNNEKVNPRAREAILYMHSLPSNQFLTLLLTKEKVFISYAQTDTVFKKVTSLKRLLIDPLFKTMNQKGIPEADDNPLYFNIRKHASSLYNLLVLPFSKQLHSMKIEHLVVVPDSIIGIFPIEVLLDEEDNRYVLDKDYSISYSPNLSRMNKITNKSKNLLFVSPESPEKKESGFNKDLSLIETLLPVTKVRGERATKLGLFNAVTNKPMSILYIASHAQFEKNFVDSYIQLSSTDKLSVKDFERMTSSLSARAHPPELIILSACETAQSDGGSIDASLGLAGVAARSGANTVIASLWVTRSPEVLLGRTGKQQDSFFHILANEGLTKAKALQESKKRLKKNRSIYEWAPFILIGDWGSY